MPEVLNIAFVDDEEAMQTIVELRFKNEIKEGKVKIHYFLNGEECANYLRKESHKLSILLILSDINMPVMDGFTLLEIIKKNYPQIEVFMLSAYGTSEYFSKADQLGADDFFTKPVDFAKLKDKIFQKFPVIAGKIS